MEETSLRSNVLKEMIIESHRKRLHGFAALGGGVARLCPGTGWLELPVDEIVPVDFFLFDGSKQIASFEVDIEIGVLFPSMI